MADLVGSGIDVNAEAHASPAREGFATATDLADITSCTGIAVRDAHGVVARAVREAEGRGSTWPTYRLPTCAHFHRW